MVGKCARQGFNFENLTNKCALWRVHFAREARLVNKKCLSIYYLDSIMDFKEEVHAKPVACHVGLVLPSIMFC